MIVVTGASASGKTETAKELGRLFNIKRVVTHTTRPKRPGEIDGVDYHFVTREKFLELKAQNFFVETTEYNHNFYGTSRPEIADNKVLVVETSGARVFLNLHDKHILLFRLLCSQKAREQRMIERGDDPTIIKQKLLNDVTRFADAQFKDENIIEINTEKNNIEEVARFIYNTYENYLKSL